MSSDKRKQIFNYLKLSLALLLMAAVITYFLYNLSSKHVTNNQPQEVKIFPQLQSHLGDVYRIKITAPTGALQITRRDNEWYVVERSGYPASKEYLQSFTNAMLTLNRGDLISSDPASFDKLQVGEPVEFGKGTIVEFFDAQDQLIEGEHIGEVGNAIYVRALGELEVYSAKGTIVDLSNIGNWLNLEFINIQPEDIIATYILPSNGKPIMIKRDEKGDFKANEKSGVNISKAAIALSKIKLLDVAPNTRITAKPILKQTTTLNNGEQIETTLYNQYKVNWIKIRALSQTAFANEINKYSNEWAFAISKDDASRLKIGD